LEEVPIFGGKLSYGRGAQGASVKALSCGIVMFYEQTLMDG
jgi:hypothetical protein